MWSTWIILFVSVDLILMDLNQNWVLTRLKKSVILRWWSSYISSLLFKLWARHEFKHEEQKYCICRRIYSPRYVPQKAVIPKIFTKFTEKHSCHSQFSTKVAELQPANLSIKKRYGYFSQDFENLLRIPTTLNNTVRRNFVVRYIVR